MYDMFDKDTMSRDRTWYFLKNKRVLKLYLLEYKLMKKISNSDFENEKKYLFNSALLIFRAIHKHKRFCLRTAARYGTLCKIGCTDGCRFRQGAV